MNNKKAFSLIELSIVILIIGILIAGVTQGNGLYEESILVTARSVTKSAPVAATPDLITWIETTSVESFEDDQEDDGAEVTLWRNINPQIASDDFHAFATTGTAPTYNPDCINNLPCLTFDGTQFMTMTQNAGDTHELTIFVVFFTQVNEPLDGRALITGLVPDKPFALKETEGLHVFYQTSHPSNDFFAPHDAGKNIIFSLEDNGSLMVSYLNGVRQTQVVGVKFIKGFSSIKIGNALKFSLGEIIIFSRDLKQKERDRIEAYLSQKWKIKI